MLFEVLWIFDIRLTRFLQHCIIGIQGPVADEPGHGLKNKGNSTLDTLHMAAAQAIILQ